MSKPLALLFALIGALLLASISVCLAFRQPWLALLATAVSIGFIGFGFVVKAKLRKKQNRS